MSDLDIQIYFDSLFENCKSEYEIEMLFYRIYENLELCKDEMLEILKGENDE